MKLKLCLWLLGCAMCVSLGCGPVKQEILETIETNEEAFLVPLEADTGNQGHIGGLQVMEAQASKITTTRVSIAQRATYTGYAWFSYKWIPTEKLVKVQTSPVNREWNGQARQNSALAIESIDSIELDLPATITCSVARGNGAKFRYYFSGQTLEQAIDTEIHGYFQAKAAAEFGRLPLDEINLALEPKGQAILEMARKFFEPRGITIEFFGWIGGARYGNPEIQAKIDAMFVAENDALVAQQEQEVQTKQNEILISKAEAERDAALSAFQNREAVLFRAKLDIAMLRAETAKALAERFDGTLPKLVPAGSGLLFGLDSPFETSLPEANNK
jgi:hypothetical protein